MHIQTHRLTYQERAKFCLAHMGQQLFNLMDEKQTNLALSADVTQAAELIQLADQLGPEICLFKTHIDIIRDFTPALTDKLRELARKHHFYLFEDRKFADIGNTVKQQYEGGCYEIASWADIINAHTLPGPGMIQALAQTGRQHNRGLLLLAEMSSQGHLMSAEYIQQTVSMAEQYPDFVIGFIAQHAVSPDPQWIHLSPGIKFNTDGDKLGQQYVTPEIAIIHQGTDIMIVGRGIINAADPVSEAQCYREAGWHAYQERLRQHQRQTHTA